MSVPAIGSAETPALASAEPAEKKVDPAIHEVAKEFEGLLVRQLLEASKVTGEGGGAGGYDSMALDALTQGVTAGGGLGLTHSIERALSGARHEKAP